MCVSTTTNHYRAEYADRSRLPERLQRLNKPLHMLLKTAHTNAAAVVLINHEMQSSVDGSFDTESSHLETMLCPMPVHTGPISMVDILIADAPN
jgi:hypothetical protein